MIHALMVVVVGIFISAQMIVFAHAHNHTNDLAVAGTWTNSDSTSDHDEQHKDNGSVPCPHGGCATCCSSCASIGACVFGKTFPVIRETASPRVLHWRPLVLADFRLKCLPYRPPCVDA